MGSDVAPEQLAAAAENLAAAGFEGGAELLEGDARAAELKPGWNALVASNPPYGERVGDERELVPVYRALGARLAEEAAGYRVALLSGNPTLTAALGEPLLGQLERTALKNGAIDCELLTGELA